MAKDKNIRFSIGDAVSTPYGVGVVQYLRYENDSYSTVIVKPSNWNMAENQTPTFYMNQKDCTPYFKVGEIVMCSSYGEGKIIDYRSSDQMYVIALSNWKLATNQNPLMYAKISSLSPIVQSKVDQSDTKLSDKIFRKYMEHAAEAKAEGNKYFNMKEGKYELAVQKYLECVNIIQKLSEKPINAFSSNQRAEIFKSLVPCHNNLALCYFHLKIFPKCIQFANNAMTLINAMQVTIPNGKVWKCLIKQHDLNLLKLLAWKRKSFWFQAKAELILNNYKEAKRIVKEAMKTIQDNDPEYQTEYKKWINLLVAIKKEEKINKNKEKNLWSKAFQVANTMTQEEANGAEEVEEEEEDTIKKDDIQKAVSMKEASGLNATGMKDRVLFKLNPTYVVIAAIGISFGYWALRSRLWHKI